MMIGFSKTNRKRLSRMVETLASSVPFWKVLQSEKQRSEWATSKEGRRRMTTDLIRATTERYLINVADLSCSTKRGHSIANTWIRN